jgi:hypothetical protein
MISATLPCVSRFQRPPPERYPRPVVRRPSTPRWVQSRAALVGLALAALPACTALLAYPQPGLEPELAGPRCANGADDDLDGLFDCEDPQCECGEVVEIAAGRAHSCIRSAGGNVLCWGRGDEGQLGDAWARSEPSPRRGVRALSTVRAIAAGGASSCALDGAGRAWCWGELADGAPVPVPVEGASSARSIGVGEGFACVLLESGRVACWGDGSLGQLGPGSVGSTVPVEIPGVEGATRIGVGPDAACAVLDDASILCWGSDSGFLAGQGRAGREAVEVATLAEAAGLAVSSTAMCAWSTVGQVVCRGAGTEWSTQQDWASIVGVTLGRAHQCVTLLGGEVQCVGDNSRGQLGDASFVSRDELLPAPGIVGASDVDAGDDHTCALRQPGRRLVCWGANGDGQLGDGSVDDDPSVTGAISFGDPEPG